MEKIALVLFAMDLGGAQRVASDLSLEFAKKHDVTIIVFEGKDSVYPYGGKLVSLDFHFYEGGGIFSLLNLVRQVVRLRRFLRENHFDRIFSFMEGGNYPAVLADKRTIASIHCNPDRCYSKRDWLSTRVIYPRAKKVIAVSRAIEENIRQRLKLKNAVCIYNPVDFPRITERAKEPVDFEGDYIVAVGRLAVEKNYPLLVDAFARSRAKEQCSLLIVGEGKHRQALEQRIADNAISARVKLMGYQENPYKFIARARFLVVSSDTEAFPMSVIEALGLGIPVVSTDCPTGPAEIITDGQNGLLTEVGNADALSKAIDRMYFSDALYDSIKSRAKESVSHLHVERIAEEMLKL